MRRRGEGPFRSGSPVKDYFATNVQAFNDHEIKAKVGKLKKKGNNIFVH